MLFGDVSGDIAAVVIWLCRIPPLKTVHHSQHFKSFPFLVAVVVLSHVLGSVCLTGRIVQQSHLHRTAAARNLKLGNRLDGTAMPSRQSLRALRSAHMSIKRPLSCLCVARRATHSSGECDGRCCRHDQVKIRRANAKVKEYLVAVANRSIREKIAQANFTSDDRSMW